MNKLLGIKMLYNEEMNFSFTSDFENISDFPHRVQ